MIFLADGKLIDDQANVAGVAVREKTL
jgi:hypothetical protein